MGCIGYNVYPSGFKLEEQIKKKYRQIIAKDNIFALVSMPEQENMPANVQISEAGLQWSTIHFCCRYDASICLDYFLKKSYIQNPRQYISFINGKTADGFTALHLCTTWKAIKCFYILINYGGINLLKKNGQQKTSFDIAREYGQKEMLVTLTKLKAKYGVVTQWKNTLLQESPDINLIINRTIYDEKMQNLRLSINSQAQMGISQPQEEVESYLLKKTKNLLDLKREKLYQKIKSIQLKRNELTADLQMDINEQKIENGSRFLQEGNKIGDNIISVQEQIEQIKAKMQLLEMERQSLLLEKEKRKIDMTNPEQIKKINLTIDKFRLFREKLIKEEFPFNLSLENEGEIKIQLSHNSKISHESRDAQGIQKLPIQIRQKYAQAKKKGFFQDQQFPCRIQSLGGKQYQNKISNIKETLVWLKPKAFFNEQYHLFNGIDPNDIKQGQLGICYCLATISKYAQKPKKIKEIFQFYDVSIGFYVLRFYTNGKINYVLVDDYFPCHSETNQPLFSKPIGNQIWVLLIEKAWSKIVGSYFATEKMTPDFFMQDLTGSPTYGDWFKHKTDKMKEILQFYEKNYMIVLTSGNNKMQGIVNNHAYSLLKIISHNNSNIYKVRNPWGHFQWNGTYGENSPLWTQELKEKVQFIDGDDGVFFLSQSEILQAFQYYSIGMDEVNSVYSYVEITSLKNEDLFFKFELKKASKVAIRFTQQFKRLVKDKNYGYSPVIFQIGKLEGSQVKFLSEGNDKCSFGQKSVYACKQMYTAYQQGQYFIRLRIQWNNPQKYNTGVLSAYCDQTVSFQRLPEEQGQLLWEKLLYSYFSSKKMNRLDQNISYATSWMRGQLVCYCALNQSSKPNSFKVNWHFNVKELQNCDLSKGRIKEDTIQCVLSSQKSYGIGTLQRISISRSCKFGSVSIKTIKT